MTGRTLLIALSSAMALASSSKECASCHPAIYASYMRTSMAASSGAAGAGVPREDFGRSRFSHDRSGIQYAVSPDFTMELSGGSIVAGATKRLAYFVGSGATARSYLLEDDGYLFEAPVAYYAKDKKWELAPGYSATLQPYLTRPVQPGCLSCHASNLKPVARTQNRFGSPAFEEGGVSCERCHGAGEAHIAEAKAGRRGAIVNPAKLDAERRDGVCAQCHLSGEVRVLRPGARWNSFQAGGRLADSQTVFVRSDSAPGLTVTGHVEKLAQSACKKASGDRLWCGSCHDPHPSQTTSVRTRCLACHQTESCKESSAQRTLVQDNCVSCHMPRQTATDAQHVVYTDHSIPRRPRTSGTPAREPMELVPFDGRPARDRDVALAYAIVAARANGSAYRARAEALLEKFAGQDDPEVLLYLAEIYRNTGRSTRAIPLYERAMKLDADQVTGSVGLGAIRMERGEYPEAIRLWEDALAKNAGLVLVRRNLAVAYQRVGELGKAREQVRRARSMDLRK